MSPRIPRNLFRFNSVNSSRVICTSGNEVPWSFGGTTQDAKGGDLGIECSRACPAPRSQTDERARLNGVDFAEEHHA